MAPHSPWTSTSWSNIQEELASFCKECFPSTSFPKKQTSLSLMVSYVKSTWQQPPPFFGSPKRLGICKHAKVWWESCDTSGPSGLDWLVDMYPKNLLRLLQGSLPWIYADSKVKTIEPATLRLTSRWLIIFFKKTAKLRLCWILLDSFVLLQQINFSASTPKKRDTLELSRLTSPSVPWPQNSWPKCPAWLFPLRSGSEVPIFHSGHCSTMELCPRPVRRPLQRLDGIFLRLCSHLDSFFGHVIAKNKQKSLDYRIIWIQWINWEWLSQASKHWWEVWRLLRSFFTLVTPRRGLNAQLTCSNIRM